LQKESTCLFRGENEPPNGLRYPRVGETRCSHFDGTSFKSRKVPENAQTPTSQVHALLGAFFERRLF